MAMANEKVLIVEDDATILSLCCRLLEAEGYRVQTSVNGEEALRRLSGEAFDLVLTDVRLPGMTGLELAKRVRERSLDLPIVTMTGHGNLETAIQALSLGVDEFILKPFTVDLLRRTLSRALEKTQLRRENARLRALMPLFEHTRAFVGATTTEQLHARIVEAVSKTVRADAVALLELDEQAQLFKLVGGRGTELIPYAGATLPLQDAQALLLQGKEPLKGWRGDEAMRLPFGFGARKGSMVIGATLLSHDKQLGVLLARALPGSTFTVSDAEALTIFAGQAAVALENAQLIAELRQAYMELQDLDNLKGEFINIAAHELRTPLAVLIGYALMLSEKLQGAEREQLQYILSNAERLRRIVDNMFSLRFVELGQAELQLETFDLGQALRSVVEAYRSLANQKEQPLTLELADGLGEITADRAMLDLMVGNLLSNAIKFSGRGGPIRVRGWSDDNHVTIVVRDQGRGVPAAEQEKIFERFYQAGSSLTREEGGLGLGLAITRGMVRAHRGRIWVESELGKGSAFYISLPRHATTATVHLRDQKDSASRSTPAAPKEPAKT